MLNDFWLNVNYGINHVLDINGYDHVLFLMVLAVPYLFENFKRVLLLVSIFTIGHTLSLILAAYNYVNLNGDIVEFLIPITILITALFNVLYNKKKTKRGFLIFTTLLFGIIHGLGFAREFKMFAGDEVNKPLLLIEFALGIEIAQLIIVFVVLFLGLIAQTVLRVSKRDWVMVTSAIVIGLVIPLVLNSAYLN